MRFWLWFWGFMVVWMSVSVIVFLFLDMGYAKNSYLMYISLIIASLMYQWAFKQHQKLKEHKRQNSDLSKTKE